MSNLTKKSTQSWHKVDATLTQKKMIEQKRGMVSNQKKNKLTQRWRKDEAKLPQSWRNMKWTNKTKQGCQIREKELTQRWRKGDAKLTQRWRKVDAKLTQNWRNVDATLTQHHCKTHKPTNDIENNNNKKHRNQQGKEKKNETVWKHTNRICRNAQKNWNPSKQPKQSVQNEEPMAEWALFSKFQIVNKQYKTTTARHSLNITQNNHQHFCVKQHVVMTHCHAHCQAWQLLVSPHLIGWAARFNESSRLCSRPSSQDELIQLLIIVEFEDRILSIAANVMRWLHFCFNELFHELKVVTLLYGGLPASGHPRLRA